MAWERWPRCTPGGVAAEDTGDGLDAMVHNSGHPACLLVVPCLHVEADLWQKGAACIYASVEPRSTSRPCAWTQTEQGSEAPAAQALLCGRREAHAPLSSASHLDSHRAQSKASVEGSAETACPTGVAEHMQMAAGT